MCPSVNRDVIHALFFYLFGNISCLYCLCLKGFLDTLRLDRGTSVKLLEWYEYMQLEQEREMQFFTVFKMCLSQICKAFTW